MADTVEATRYDLRFGEAFQKHILACCARVPSFVTRYRSALKETYFTNATSEIVAKALFVHVDEFHSLPTKTTLVESVRPDCQGDSEFAHAEKLIDFVFEDDVSDAPAVMKKTVEFGKQQAMCLAVCEAADQIESGKRDGVLKIIQDARAVGEDILDVGIHFGQVQTRAEWYTLSDVNQDVIPTGLWHLDRALGGGLGRGELGLVLAPPKRGKSTTLINFGFNAVIMGYNVAHYTLEMREKKVFIRYDDRLAGPLIKFKKVDPERYANELNKRAKDFMRGQLFIKEYPTRAATVSTIRSHLSMLASRGYNADMVIVDYGDIVKPERRLGEMRHEQAGVYEDLRTLAGEFDVALWTGSQTNKGALDKPTVTMGDVAESFEKIAIVDAAVAFCQTDEEKIEQKCRLFMAALRNAESGSTVECNFDPRRCYVQSFALYDAAYNRLDTPPESEEKTAVTQSTPATSQRPHGTKIDALKNAAEISPSVTPPQRKQVMNSVIGVPPAMRKQAPAPGAARRKQERPDRKVNL